jgi:hypothetical protein
MSPDPISLEGKFIPDQPLHPEGAAFFSQISEMLDGQPKDPAVVETALSGWDGLMEKIAAELYHVGSMILGEGEETILLIEHVVANVDIPACSDHLDARHKSRLALGANAIGVLHKRNSASLRAPAGEDGPASCIEDDDLSAAGVTHAELEQMLTGPENQHLRSWLEGLPVSQRAIFVLRAIGGLSSIEVAVLLAENGGAEAQDWTPDGVRSSFRQALCSLASQLIHATYGK